MNVPTSRPASQIDRDSLRGRLMLMLAAMGVPAAGGGRHASMGTHNALWGLGGAIWR